MDLSRFDFTAIVRAKQPFSLMETQIDWKSVDEIFENEEIHIYDRETQINYKLDQDVSGMYDEEIVEAVKEKIEEILADEESKGGDSDAR